MGRWIPVLLLAAATALLLPAAALAAATVTAHTSQSGSCRLDEVASRSATEITYGARVTDCSTRFGVRYAVSSGLLYDRTRGGAPDGGQLKRKRGDVPYSHTKTYTIPPMNAGDDFFTRTDVAVVLKQRRSHGARHVETWKDPGPLCRVTTTRRASDTLACHFTERL